MKLTEKELNGVIQEAITMTFNRLIKEYKEEKEKSLDEVFFEGEKMDKLREWLTRGGWELVDMLDKNYDTKEVKYIVYPSNGEKAKAEWAMMGGRIGEIFGQQIKIGTVKKEVINPKAKKSKKYDPSADENVEKTGAHWFILKRNDIDWDATTPLYMKLKKN